MISRLLPLALLAALAAPFAACAQSGLGLRSAIIDDPIKVVFRDPPGLSMDRMHELITVSAAARQWQRVADDDGRMQLLLVVKGAHQMRVELAYHPRGYTIKYLDSINMNYREQQVDGLQARVIHKRYNQWVRELATAINSGLGVSAQIVPVKFLARCLAAALALPLSAAAQKPNDLGDYRLAFIDDPVRVALSPGPTAQNVRHAIGVVAAAESWTIDSESAGVVKLRRAVRGKHEVRIELSYDAAGYRIRYVGSANMLYREAQNGARAIHRNYNVWIGELAKGINDDLGEPAAKTTAGFAEIEDREAVPYLRERGREAYATFLTKPKPRAFALAPGGAYGFAWGGERTSSLSRPDRALEICRSRSSEGCRLYAVDDSVVWAETPATLAAVPAPADPAGADAQQIRTPLPASIAIEAPRAEAGPATQALSGAWSGKWGDMIDHTIVIERIVDGAATFIYSWNPAQFGGGSDTGWLRVVGTLGEDGVLRGVVEGRAGIAVVTYRLSADRSALLGEYRRDGQLSTGIFERVALQPRPGARAAADAPAKALVIRRNHLFGAVMTYSIFVGAEEVATLNNAQHTEILVPPGSREITAKCRGPYGIPIVTPVRFSARPGEQLFFVVGPGCSLERSDAATAKELLSGNTRVSSSRPQGVTDAASASPQDKQTARLAQADVSAPPGYATPLPPDLKIVTPGPAVPASAAAFSGAWIGKWDGRLDHTLVVERIDGKRAFLVYALHPDQMAEPGARGWSRREGTIDEDGVLRSTFQTKQGPVDVSYRLSADRTQLLGERLRGGRQITATLERATPPSAERR